MVGIIPDRANVAGKLNMAGPVNEFTAMDIDPNIPMVPIIDKVSTRQRLTHSLTSNSALSAYLYDVQHTARGV
jgi:hypothetical protein